MECRRFQHGIIDSTNEHALGEVEAGRARHGDVHVAAGQTAGRGRRGHSWESAPGEGLYLSMIWMPEALLPPPALTVAAGLALVDTCRALGLDDARLKWPNDLILAEAKLAGILVETRGLQARRPHYVVGVGLNVLQTTFPPSLLAERPTTSLALAGIDVDVRTAQEELVRALWRRLEQIEAAPERLERDYPRAAGLDRGPLRVESAEGAQEGTLADFRFETGLVLETPDGPRRLPLEHVRQVRPRATPSDGT